MGRTQPSVIVILSNAKNLALGLSKRPCEILRFTQDDNPDDKSPNRK